MAKKELKKTAVRWKKVVWNILGILGGYLLLQLVNALLVTKELVGEEKGALLLCISAGVAALISSLLLLRGEQNGRLPLCLGSASGFVGILVLTALAFGEGLNIAGQVIGLLLSAAVGGLLAAVIGGGGKKKKRVRRG